MICVKNLKNKCLFPCKEFWNTYNNEYVTKKLVTSNSGEIFMNFKKLLKGGMVAAMATSMVACGSSSSSTSSTTSTADASSTASTTETTSTGDAIKIGISGPLTGGAAVYGNAVKNAAELAIEEVNALGGLQFELRFEDDTHDAEKAVTSYGVLKDWGMQVSLLTVTSTPGAAVAPSYAEDHIFALTPSASSLAVIYQDAENQTNAYGNVFQMCFTDPNQGVASADYINEHASLLGEKVGIIYKSDDNYSTGIYEKFIAEAESLGLSVVYTGSFDDSNASDFSVLLTQAQEKNATLLFLPIYYDPASVILKQANDMGYEPTFFGVDGMDGILSVEGFDTSLAEGVYLLTPFSADATDDKTVSFVTKYEEKYGDTPNQFAADVYDCIYAIYQAASNAGVDASWDASTICDALTSEFTSMTFDGITGTEVTWNANGEVSKSPKAVVIENGVYVGVED